MSETMLALLGSATTIMIIVLLLRNITVSAIAFIGVSTMTALILVLTNTFTVKEMGGFIKADVQGVRSTVALFIFSVLFFGIAVDVGMFNRIINALMKRVGHNVVGVALMTCIIAMTGHLNGGGASTFLVTIPAVLPVYKCPKMRPTTLLLICMTAMGVINPLPWGNPTMRTTPVLGMRSNVLRVRFMPMQVVGTGITLFTAVFWGLVERKKGADIDNGLAANDYGISGIAEEVGDHGDLVRPGMFWFNVCLTLFIIVCLMWLPVPSYYTFMLRCVIALLANYLGAGLQDKIIKSHTGPASVMVSTILVAGMFLGMLEDSKIMSHMANVLASFIPQSMGRFLPLIIGVLSMPLTLMFCTDSYFHGLLPVLIGVGDKFGVDPVHIDIAMVVCHNYATFISPVVLATFLGMGLAGVEIKDHIRASFFWIWGISLVRMMAGLLLGVLSVS